MNLQLRKVQSFDNERPNLWEFILNEKWATQDRLSAFDELLEKWHCFLGV